MLSARVSMSLDTSRVHAAVARENRRALGYVGGYIRKVAVNSIKRAPYVTAKPRGGERTDFRRVSSPPGSPPYSRSGRLKHGIRYAVESDRVVIGPVGLVGPGLGEAPATLEFGGNLPAKRGRRFTAGDFLNWGYGPMVVGPGPKARLTFTEQGKVPVTRARITTIRQAARAAQIHNQLGIGGRPAAAVAARPYMGPAFQAVKDRLAGLWRDSVRG
jgi:hypothetical protein